MSGFTKENAERFFNQSTYWEFEKCLGNGSYGLAVMLREREKYVRRTRRMAVKVALLGGDKELENEIKWLKELRGGKHIGRMLAHCKDMSASNEQRQAYVESLVKLAERRREKLDSLPPSSMFVGLAGMAGPAVALEYIENGTLLQFKNRIVRSNIKIPNRVLWSIFLCLIRSCIALAYPPGKTEEQPDILETIPTNTRARQIVHGDIASRNLMFGEGDGLDEHNVEHVLKMIDFGKTYEVDADDERTAPSFNIYQIGNVIYKLIVDFPYRMGRVNHKGFLTDAGPILHVRMYDPFPGVDVDLRDLVARCLYTQPESDEAIRAFWQQVLNDPE